MTKPGKTILFICTHNSARSQMAEGLVNAFHGDRYEAFSAGTEPAEVNPRAIRAMAELGIDISGHTVNGIDEFLNRDIDCVVTVCDHANEARPFFPGGNDRIHKGFADPAAVTGPEEEKLEAFRRTRDEIRAWIAEIFPWS
ncbi:MAG: arsenate reductase ArsC [Deltaproteobacteria bacterium]|nr:arsenate reductase ArsC [Deltaproteobacteria bacterium]